MDSDIEKEKMSFESLTELAARYIKEESEKTGGNKVNISCFIYSLKHGVSIITPSRMTNDAEKLNFVAAVISLICMLDDVYLVGTTSSCNVIDTENPRLRKLAGSDDPMVLQQWVLKKYGQISESPYTKSMVIISADTQNTMFTNAYFIDPTEKLVDLSQAYETHFESDSKQSINPDVYNSLFSCLLDKAIQIKRDFVTYQSQSSRVIELTEYLRVFFLCNMRLDFNQEWVNGVKSIFESMTTKDDRLKVIKI